MDNNKVNYIFHYREHFFTIQKGYNLRLRKTDEGIQISKEEKASTPEIKDAPINHGERFSGRMTAGGVY
jgi:hypothetical protein